MAAAQVASVRQGEQLPERRWAQPRRPHEQVQTVGLPDRQPVQHQDLRDQGRSQAGAVR